VIRVIKVIRAVRATLELSELSADLGLLELGVVRLSLRSTEAHVILYLLLSLRRYHKSSARQSQKLHATLQSQKLHATITETPCDNHRNSMQQSHKLHATITECS
jgi:hypothetical protein